MAEFDPNDASVDEVLKKLEKASPDEQERILSAERAGKKRKTILEEYGVDPDQRVDAAGRVLYPWEVDPENHVYPVRAEAPKEGAAQAEFAQRVEAARPNTEQRGGTAAGVGTAAGGAAGSGEAGTGGTAATPA